MAGKNRPSSNPNLSIEINMIMKKIFLFAAFAAVLAGCSDDITTNSSEPVKPGSDITFGISLSENPQSRTMYGSEKNDAFPVYWVNDEQILVASPQCAAGRTLATYKVSVDNAVSNTATAVTKVSEAGVQWGETLPANFYSIYPVGYTTTADKVENKITNNTDNAVAHLNVRNYQRNVFTLNGTTWEGVPVDRASNEDIDLCQKYPDALMYAQKKMNERGDVMLQFNPFTVAFNITLSGYDLKESLGNDPKLTIEEIIITAPEGTNLAGNFDATFDAACANAPEVTTAVNTLTTKNVIHIPTLSSVDGNYLTINKDQSLSFNVFAIPTGNTVTADWTITVRTVSGTFTHNLAAAAPDKSAVLVPGKVHKLKLPKFKISNEFNFDVTKWMTQIPRNIYITELSVPGAWNTLDNSHKNKGYQTENVATLWSKGVRAFGVETRTSSTRSGISYNPSGVQLSGTGSNPPLSDAYYNGVNVKTLFEEILTQVNSSPQEYGVFVLTYADGGEGGHRSQDYAYWLEGIYNVYNSLNDAQKALIYQGPITTETTVNDVLGKLILIVQVGSNLPGGNIAKGDYKDNLPALFAHMNMKWTGASTGTDAPVSNLYWSTWEDSYLTNISGTMSPTSMYWNYTQANRTQINTNGDANLPTYEDRQNAILSILDKSRDMYLSGEHNIWFYVGAGGAQTTSLTASTNATTFASTMNGWINTQLKNKIEKGDFSPFGIVMCNYMSGTTYYGEQIIDNIIKMNRLFRLNRNESAPEWPDANNNNNNNNTSGGGDTSSQSKSAGSFSVDTDNWEVF